MLRLGVLFAPAFGQRFQFINPVGGHHYAHRDDARFALFFAVCLVDLYLVGVHFYTSVVVPPGGRLVYEQCCAIYLAVDRSAFFRFAK